MTERRSPASTTTASLAVLSTLVVMLAAIALAPAPAARAADAAREIKWADLVPPSPPRSKLAGRSMFALPPGGTFNIGGDGPNTGDGTPAPPPGPEARWMSAPAKRKTTAPPAVVATLDGQRVRIGGYVVPLDFDATSVKEFLLVPFVGACIHVPPPPANQIVYVKSDKGFDVKGTFDPVTVTGTLTTAGQFTGLAETGYTITAEMVEPRKP
jgi:hypothetical protein